jgi:hypothetical protein
VSSDMKNARWQIAQEVARVRGDVWEDLPYAEREKLLGEAQDHLNHNPSEIPIQAALWREEPVTLDGPKNDAIVEEWEKSLTPEPAPELAAETGKGTETVNSWEEAPDELKEFFQAADISADELTPWDVARAWKVLVVIRDVALGRDDFDRAPLYSAIARDLADTLAGQGWPIPTLDGTGVQFLDETP